MNCDIVKRYKHVSLCFWLIKLTTDDDAISRIPFVKNSILDILRIIIFIETTCKRTESEFSHQIFRRLYKLRKLETIMATKNSQVLIVPSMEIWDLFPLC